MNEIIVIERDVRCCANCGIPMTSATAEDREDGLYCDRCITQYADETPSARALGLPPLSAASLKGAIELAPELYPFDKIVLTTMGIYIHSKYGIWSELRPLHR